MLGLGKNPNPSMGFAYGGSRMPLRVISRVSFLFWGDFGEKSHKCKHWKIWALSNSYAKAWDTLIAARLRCQNGTPRVFHGCHAPDPGPTRLANPNRFRVAKPYTGTPYILFSAEIILVSIQ